MSDEKRKDYGGGVTVRRVTLTDSAARALRYRVTGQYAGVRYTKEQADAAASEIIQLFHDHQLVAVLPEMIAALPWLEQAKQMCSSEEAQRGLDQLIAALWVAKNQQGME